MRLQHKAFCSGENSFERSEGYSIYSFSPAFSFTSSSAIIIQTLSSTNFFFIKKYPQNDETGVTAGGGVGKVEPGPKPFFFLVSTSAQLSAYANHEFKIIPTPAQLSAYANHEFKN